MNTIKRLSQSLFLRVVLVFIAVLVLSNSITFAFMNRVFRSNTFDEVLRGQVYSMQKVKSEFENWTDHLEQSTLDIIYDSNIQQSLTGKVNRSEIIRRLTQLAYQEGLFILYADNHGNLYSSNNVFQPELDVSRYTESELYDRFRESYAELEWTTQSSAFLRQGLKLTERILLTAGRQVRHLELNVDPGFLIVQTAPGKLAPHIDDPLMKKGTRYFLITSSGDVLYDSEGRYDAGDSFPDSALLSTALSGSKTAFCESEFGKQLFIFDKTKKTNLLLVSCLPEDAIYEEKSLTNRLLSILLFSTVAVVLIVLLGAVSFLRPLNQIIQAQRQVRNGEYGTQVNVQRADEIGELALSFNKMSSDLKVQFARIRENEQHLKNAEMDALMYQFTPHFLYNTLDNINMLAKCSEEKRISMMITELSALLRGTLSVKTETVCVKDEFAHAEHYLKIMQIRYPNLFNYSFVCPQELEGIPVLKLMLQPLVENCIHHAFEYMSEGGWIRVSVAMDGQWLRICVEDNGRPLSTGRKIQMNDAIRNNAPERSGGKNVGLANVFRRGRIFYGENSFDLLLDDSAMGGLCVQVSISMENQAVIL